MTDHDEEPQWGTTIQAQISRALVQLLREYTGRGPTTARTTIRDNVVLVMLDQSLTKAEQLLVSNGRAEKVLDVRRELQVAMRSEASARIAEITGTQVLAMLSANHIDPDLGAEIFVLSGPPNHATAASSRFEARP